MKLFTTCVNYADYLANTVGQWAKFGDVHVISKHADMHTMRLCHKERVRFVPTDAWDTNGSTINKGAALGDVIPRYASPGEQIILFDADCFPIGTPQHTTPPGIMVGCFRYMANTPEALEAHLTAGIALPAMPVGSYKPHLVRGFFQMFRFTPELTFHNRRHNSFSGCDMHLAAQFEGVWLSNFYVVHLGENRKNWRGRVTPEWK